MKSAIVLFENVEPKHSHNVIRSVTNGRNLQVTERGERGARQGDYGKAEYSATGWRAREEIEH